MFVSLLLGLLLQITTNQPLSTFDLQCNTTGASSAATYQWTKEIGPTDAPFSNPTAKNTKVSFITEGLYLLKCTVKDGTKVPGEAYSGWTVGANFIPPVSPVSPIKVSILQVPPSDVTDFTDPVITQVSYIRPGGAGFLPITKDGNLTLQSGAFAGFSLTASDNGTLLNAQLLVDDTRVHSVGLDSSLPAAFNLWWLKNPIATGTHKVIIRVYDGAGRYAEFKFNAIR